MRRWAVLAAFAVTGVVTALAGAPTAGAAPTAADPASPRLVVVGAPGLSWSDLDGGELPELDALAEQGALGSLTVRAVRSRACAVDGWLTLSAGRRAADLPGSCREPLPVVDGSVPRWAEYVVAAGSESYDAHPGALGDAVTASGSCVETVGPGAAIAGAEANGQVTTWSADLPASFRCPVVLVDGGTLPASGAGRAAALARLDDLVGRVRSADPRADVVVAGVGDGLSADPGADVVVAGVGDGVSAVRPRAIVAAGPSFGRGLLTSASTRQPGVAQLQDLTATALTRVGASDAAVTGRPLTVSSTGSGSLVAGRVGFETRAATLRALSPQLTLWLAVAYALWAVVVAVLWRRRTPLPDAVPAWLRGVGVALAATPVSTFVVNLVAWWRAGAPAVAFLGGLAVVVALLTAAALWAGGRRPLGALRLVAVATLVVLAGDVLTGSRLQLGAAFGQNPVVGGRFYGLGNTSFALYGLAVLVVVGWVAASGASRRRAALLALVVLVAALGIEALPSLGADFGGPPGLLLGGLLVIASAAGVRLTRGRVLAAVLGAGALAAVVALLDWLRPAASRTHLGEFVESVFSGEAGAVVGRKLAQNVTNLGSPPLLVVALATVVLVVAGWRLGWRALHDGAVVLRGASVMSVVAFLANDSGLVIPAFVAVVLAPLLVAAGPEGELPRHHGDVGEVGS